MRILIIGGGKVGLFIARELSEQHEVVVVENNIENQYFNKFKSDTTFAKFAFFIY